MLQTRFIQDVLVVVVIFNQNAIEVLTRLQNGQSAEGLMILVYDNSPQSQQVPDYVNYIHDSKNRGLSVAYNTAYQLAKKNGKSWMLLLDQDTHFSVSLLTKYRDAVQRFPTTFAFVPKLKDDHGYVSPFKWRFASGEHMRTFSEKLPLGEFRFANSGLLINCNSFDNARGYIEEIPLDFSDIGFCERLKSITDHFVVLDLTLEHNFSANEIRTAQDALFRFKLYCKGAAAMGKLTTNSFIYFLRAFGRSVKLSFRYKTIVFTVEAFKIFFRR